MSKDLREAARALVERFGVPAALADWTVREAVDAGVTAEDAARLLYANLGGRLTLRRCREAAALFPLRSRRAV